MLLSCQVFYIGLLSWREHRANYYAIMIQQCFPMQALHRFTLSHWLLVWMPPLLPCGCCCHVYCTSEHQMLHAI